MAEAALTEVTLPSGSRVRGHLPTLGTLLRRNLLPRDLLSVAMKAANPAWLQAARAVDPNEGADAARYLAVLVAAFPRHRWVGPGPDDWEPWRITPDDLLEDAVDEADIDAMENLVLRMMTPDQVSAASRVILGLDTEAAAAAGEEVPAAIADWEPFRGEPVGAARGADGGALGHATQPAAGRRRRGGGVRPRRGAGSRG